MGTFHGQGGSVSTPAIEVRGSGSVVTGVAVCPALTVDGRIEVQESAIKGDAFASEDATRYR